MNSMQWIIGIIVVVLIGGGIFLLNSGSSEQAMEGDVMMKDVKKEEKGAGAMMDEAMMEKEKDTMMQGDSMMKDEDAMMEKGSYEAYAPEKLAKADTGDVVLFFRAPWCSTCRALDAAIRSSAGEIPGGLTILDVNYDTETALKQKYGVTTQHTLVQVSSDGTLIKKWQGSSDLAALVTQVI